MTSSIHALPLELSLFGAHFCEILVFLLNFWYCFPEALGCFVIKMSYTPLYVPTPMDK